MVEPTSGPLIRSSGLGDYFHNAVQQAADRAHLAADAATLHYLASLLSDYSRSERVFDYNGEHLQLRPLALLYAEALEAPSAAEQRLWLQRLGDLAIFVGGLFAGRLSRRFQNLDYCVSMGGTAYSVLQQNAAQRARQDQALVFGELAMGFRHFVALVAEVTGRVPTGPDEEAPMRNQSSRR